VGGKQERGRARGTETDDRNDKPWPISDLALPDSAVLRSVLAEI